jgi:hypothetical protein
MSKKEDGTSTATRVKAFRDRLSSNSYKRVEGYVTSEEKARVDAVKAQLGVTTDIAVAGLVRMGLEQFEKSEQLHGLTKLQSPAASVRVGALVNDRPMLALVKLNEGYEQPTYVTARMVMSKGIFSAEVSNEILRQLERDPAVQSVSLSGPVLSAASAGPGTVMSKDLYTAEMETCSAQSPVVTQGLGMLGGDMAYLNGTPGELMSLTHTSVSAFAVSTNASAQNAAPVSLNATYGASVTQDNDNNPIARFFKHRKEMNNA